MSTHSLDDLLKRLQVGPITLGWGAVLAFSRQQLNQLLAHQFVASFNTLNFMQPFNLQLALDDMNSESATLESIILGAPRLSFESATLSDSRVTLKIPLLGGTYTVFVKPLGAQERDVLSTFRITEDMGYCAEVELQLAQLQGAVDRRGRVTLNLSADTTSQFTCNLGSVGPTQRRIGDAIHNHLQLQSNYQRVFELGLLDLSFYNPLSPVSFVIRTQAAPGAENRLADNYGDGAVLVFVRLKANHGNGSLPGDDSQFPYLIPDDEADGAPLYSASMILASDMVDYAGELELSLLPSLLFPQEHIFVKAENGTHQPSDLLILGNIKPTPARVAVTPQSVSVIGDGSVQQFKALRSDGTAPGNVQWSVSCINNPLGAGAITPSGVYTPVIQAQMDHVLAPTVVTAYFSEDGQQHTASALVLSGFEIVSVAPAVYVTGAMGGAITLSASSLSGGPIDWALSAEPGLGQVAATDDHHALYTPPGGVISQPVVLQNVEARDVMGNTANAAIILVGSRSTLSVTPSYVSYLPKNRQILLKTTPDLPSENLRWSVQGGGTVDENGIFTAPAQGAFALSLVTCEFDAGSGITLTGYSIIQLSTLQDDPPRWKELDHFTLTVLPSDGSGGGKCYANGLQQIHVEIEIGTASVEVNGQSIYIPISDVELSTLKLMDHNGIELPLIEPDQEGIEFNSGINRAFHQRRNRFSYYSPTAVRHAKHTRRPFADDSGKRYKSLYIHLATEEVVTLRAKFQADNGAVWESHQVGKQPFEVTAQGIKPPTVVKEHYDLIRQRVFNGEGDIDNPDDPFSFMLDSIDYWSLTYKRLGMYPVKFATLSIQENVSTLQWESEQRDETFFSYTGYAFYPARYSTVDNPPAIITFDPYLRALAKATYEKALNTQIQPSAAPSPGQLIISLNRVADMPYWYDRMAAGDVNKEYRRLLDPPVIYVLIDEEGNRHRLSIGFEGNTLADSRNVLVLSVQ